MLRSFTRRTATNHSRCFSSPRSPDNSIQFASDLKNSQNVVSPPPPTSVLHYRHPVNNLSPLPSSPPRGTVLAVSATVLSAIAAASYVIYDEGKDGNPRSRVLNDLEHAVDRSNESLKRIVNTMKQTGLAASVLWKSLRSVMSTANHEVRSGFEVRVAALLADIVAANEVRRAAIVGAGGGVVLDWLLDTVALSGGNYATQAESARALAYLVADPNVSEAVLARPHAIPNLLRFIFSAQPHRSKKQTRRSSFDISDPLKGRSMLVAAIMDIVTSNCGNVENIGLKPVLPGNALMRDIAAALEVVEEGGMHLDGPRGGEEDEDGGTGIKGIGIKVLGGTAVLGLTRSNGLIEVDHSDTTHLASVESTSRTPLFNKINDNSPAQKHLSSAVIPGLWDDLHSQHVAVPFAAWALANWAMASGENRSHIQELDRDGHAVTTALIAPERSVKWHGSLVAKSLLEDRKLPLNGSVSDWSSSLLSTVSQASKTDDVLLAEVALSAVLLSMERSPDAQKAVMKKGLSMMRETAKRMMKHRPVQEALAYCLESLCAGDMQLPLDEGQKWSGILLSWVFEKSSSENMRSSAINVLSHILEEHGPLSIPISQGWLDILLTEVLEARKLSLRGSPQPRSDKVKTQVDQANVVSATQTAKEMAGAVVNLAVNQLGSVTDFESFPLADLLSLEPFVVPYKNLKKDDVPKTNAADSALTTLKGIKALTEICCVDSLCLNKIMDCGVITLLRRFLLQDDYEKLAAAEAYDASRDLEAQYHTSVVPSESTRAVVHDPSSLRVPSTAHIRRHAARLLTVLSVLPKVKSIIIEDKTWCKWLEECANGRIPGCNDLKIQSYARATLLNIACNDEDNNKGGINSVNSDVPHSNVLNKKQKCPQYTEMIFLISPELPHWKSPTKEEKFVHPVSAGDEGPTNCENSPLNNVSSDDSMSITRNFGSHFSNDPSIDVVFIHGIRGGPYKTWRLSECKSSSKSGLIEKIDEEAGKQGTFWPGEWLSADFPHARMFTLKYKTNLTQWSGSSLPLQEVSSMLLEKLVAAGIGDRPVVFVTHSMGGLVVKQMLYKASAENIDNLVNNTVGMVFYSCPHFGSRLADMPWRMGLVFRPAPTIGELRSGSPRLVEFNDFIRGLHKKRMLEVLSFCETKVTPIVEGYGGWAFRMEIVPIESAYPGFGELVVLDATDHVNSCKPISRTDPSYKETLDFLNKLRAACT